jgi:hypothetical protein
MSTFITYAPRTKCRKCGHGKFIQVEDDEDGYNIPVCAKCITGKPEKYRVGFTIPELGTNRFKKVFKAKNEVSETLTTLTKAKNFKSFVENKLKKEGLNFDPREIGTEKERKMFIVECLSEEYVKYQRKRFNKGLLTPSGLAKKMSLLKNHIIPIFGKCNVKQINHGLVERYLTKSLLSDAMYNEVLKELKCFLKFAAINSLIHSVPVLPKCLRTKTYGIDDYYNEADRDLVIKNIKKRNHQIAFHILTNYTARQCEVRCLRWKDVDFKREVITFSRHVSDGKGYAKAKEVDGLKSIPDGILVYPFFPGLKEMLLELTPSLDGEALIFPGRNGFMSKNVLWSSWTKSVDSLLKQKKISKKVDVHRGTRNSTLSILREKGFSEEEVGELYGGNIKTMNKHYVRRRMQNVSSIFEGMK